VSDDITLIHRDLRPGMTIEWCEEPWYLDVTAVSDPDGEGMCTIDTVQGRFVACAGDVFTEITSELADLIGSIVLDEGERLR
jgi:hypothetical protein